MACLSGNTGTAAGPVAMAKFSVDSSSMLCASSWQKTLVASTDNGTVVVVGDYDQQKSTQTAVVKMAGEIASVHVKQSFPDHFYSSCENCVYLSDRRNLSQTVCKYEFNTDDVNDILMSKCEKFLCSADDAGEVKVIAVADDRLHATMKNHSSICFCLATVGERTLVSGGYDCKLFVHDFVTNRRLQHFDAAAEIDCQSPFINPPSVIGVDASSDGCHLAAAFQNGAVCLWKKSRNKKYKRTGVIHDAHSTLGATQVKYVGGGHVRIVSGGNDGMIKFWTCDDLERPLMTMRHGPKINWLHVLQGNCFAVCDTDELSVYGHAA